MNFLELQSTETHKAILINPANVVSIKASDRHTEHSVITTTLGETVIVDEDLETLARLLIHEAKAA